MCILQAGRARDFRRRRESREARKEKARAEWQDSCGESWPQHLRTWLIWLLPRTKELSRHFFHVSASGVCTRKTLIDSKKYFSRPGGSRLPAERADGKLGAPTKLSSFDLTPQRTDWTSARST